MSGCRNRSLNSHERRTEASRVLFLLGEIETDVHVHPRSYQTSIHRDTPLEVSQQRLDALTAELCAHLRYMDLDDFSLEMQTWHRDHTQDDAVRREREAREAREREAREAREAANRAAREKAAATARALNKLYPSERGLLREWFRAGN